MKLFFLMISIFYYSSVWAREYGSIGKSPRALLMGDAYTAVADDEYTLFYNPAAMGRNQSVSMTILNPSIGGTNTLKDQDRFSNFPKSDPVAISERILNYPLNLQASIFPNIKMAQFGFNMFATSKFNAVLRNAIHPTLNVDYRYDRGFIAGFAYNFGKGAQSSRIKKSSKSKTSTGQRFSVGVGIKHVNRQGVNEQFDLFGTSLYNKVIAGNSSMDEIKRSLGYSVGKTWGADFGLEYGYSSGRSFFTAGFSVLDIGDLHFRRIEGTKKVPIQEMSVNTGIAFKQDFTIFDYTLALDLKPLTNGETFARKFHLGSELSLPLISLMTGWSEGYLSYGVSVKFWPVKVHAGFYGVEVGNKYKEQEAKRFIVYLSLFDFSIDI